MHGAWETMDTLVYGFLFWMRFDGLDWHGVPFLPVSLDLLTVTLSVSRPGGVGYQGTV